MAFSNFTLTGTRCVAIRASRKSLPRSHRKNDKTQAGCSVKRSHARRKMKYWEIIADHLAKSAWSWGFSSHIDLAGRVLFIADAQHSAPSDVITASEF